MRSGILIFLSFLLYSTSHAQNMYMDSMFREVSKGMCDCMSIFTDELSPEMSAIIVESDGDETKFQELFMEYMTENPSQGMVDATILSKADSPELRGCIARLEEEYDYLYTTLSETEVVDRVIKELEEMDGCETTVAIMKMGKNAM